jgi:hypothetical protein
MLTTSLSVLVLLCVLGSAVAGQAASDKEIAARFAPIFHQAVGEHPRGDFITNFDFDGDWDGTNNWAHAEDRSYKLTGYIYYSVVETDTHYFIQYGVFHARDYKGGDTKGVLFSDLLHKGATILSRGHEPSGLLAEAMIAHENDMEGCLVVVEKRGTDLATAKVVFVESLHHNMFARYVPKDSDRPADAVFMADGQHVDLYVQPKGHGIEAWGAEPIREERGFLTYRYTGTAEDPEAAGGGRVGYDLLPIATTLWDKAHTAPKNTAFASIKDYGTMTITVKSGGKPVEKKVGVGQLASAFRGKVGGPNAARPPWGWISNDHRDDALGLWYFDPARIVKRDFGLSDSFSTTYIKLPFWAAATNPETTTASGNR